VTIEAVPRVFMDLTLFLAEPTAILELERPFQLFYNVSLLISSVWVDFLSRPYHPDGRCPLPNVIKAFFHLTASKTYPVPGPSTQRFLVFFELGPSGIRFGYFSLPLEKPPNRTEIKS